MHRVKVTQIGNSLGVILPKDALARMRVEKGDMLSVTETEDGIRLTPYDPEVSRQIEVGRKIMRRYRNVLRELAK